MDQKDHALQILKSWHQIEFFQPYLLEQSKKSFQVTPDELSKWGNEILPWLNDKIRKQYNIPDKKVRYTLYLGLFQISEVSRISDVIFGVENDPLKAQNTEQRLDSKQPTCFAKLILNGEGVADFDNLSASTFPWAIGYLKNEKLDQLSYAQYNTRCSWLKESIHRIKGTMQIHSSTTSQPIMDSVSCSSLLQSLYEWADFTPDYEFSFLIEWEESLKRQTITEKTALLPVNDCNTDTTQKDNDQDHSEENSEETYSPLIPILNSFYIEDIEQVMRHISSGGLPSALSSYLSIAKDKLPDLYQPEGLKLITRHLDPKQTPLGRWPSDPDYDMALMQQFAINTAVADLDQGGLLSINGPPGTGKTTLLRDMVAHNVVERAKVLSQFNDVEQTLDSQGFPVSDLGGFEMIVASSNNAAVENISKELPQIKSLGKDFSHIEYLKSVANQLNAKRLDKTYRKKYIDSSGKERVSHFFDQMKPEHTCWGAIAAPLGKSNNKRDFIQRLLMDSHFERDSYDEANRPPECDYLNVWRWKKYHQDQNRSFSQSCDYFREILKKVEQQQKELNTLSQLLHFFSVNCYESYVETSRKHKILAEEKREETEQSLARLNDQQDILKHKFSIQTIKQAQLANKHPNIFKRIFNRDFCREYRNEIKANQDVLIDLEEQSLSLLQDKNSINDLLEKTQKMEKQASIAFTQKVSVYKKKQKQLQQLQEKYPDINYPKPNLLISDPDLQRRSFWQNKATNQLRSELFIAALQLHESWLIEALSIKSFRGIVLEMGHFLNDPTQEKHIIERWRALFMIVPLISTTFASLGRMLKGLTSNQLGWLMIDEAAQATPQAAVGGIWRAKRVLVVGDPQQVEPVFTTDSRLVDHLCKNILDTESDQWNPNLWSVQTIADRGNPYGCCLEVMNKPEWIGIPLWVHRRCIEPMFSLSNKIAYNNRMIHGESNNDAIRSRLLKNGAHSHWKESKGYVIDKQYTSSLGQDTIDLTCQIVGSGHPLSTIYIITPFKAVKEQLIDVFSASKRRQGKIYDQISQHFQEKTEQNRWCKNNIGTVHTFQGKENDIVIFVLGCDWDNQGGAHWAASKPNLLNVAVTRAKKHIFVIGDSSVWQDKAYFSDLMGVLAYAGECGGQGDCLLSHQAALEETN